MTIYSAQNTEKANIGHRSHSHESQPQHDTGDQISLAGTEQRSLSLLGSRNLDGRGNGPVRADAFRSVQQTQGNRAVQRAVQRTVSTPAPVPVQREEAPPVQAPPFGYSLDPNTGQWVASVNTDPVQGTASYSPGQGPSVNVNGEAGPVEFGGGANLDRGIYAHASYEDYLKAKGGYGPNGPHVQVDGQYEGFSGNFSADERGWQAQGAVPLPGDWNVNGQANSEGDWRVQAGGPIGPARVDAQAGNNGVDINAQVPIGPATVDGGYSTQNGGHFDATLPLPLPGNPTLQGGASGLGTPDAEGHAYATVPLPEFPGDPTLQGGATGLGTDNPSGEVGVSVPLPLPGNPNLEAGAGGLGTGEVDPYGGVNGWFNF